MTANMSQHSCFVLFIRLRHCWVLHLSFVMEGKTQLFILVSCWLKCWWHSHVNKYACKHTVNIVQFMDMTLKILADRDKFNGKKTARNLRQSSSPNSAIEVDLNIFFFCLTKWLRNTSSLFLNWCSEYWNFTLSDSHCSPLTHSCSSPFALYRSKMCIMGQPVYLRGDYQYFVWPLVWCLRRCCSAILKVQKTFLYSLLCICPQLLPLNKTLLPSPSRSSENKTSALVKLSDSIFFSYAT